MPVSVRSVKPPDVKAQVIRRRALGESMRKIALDLGITTNTVSRIIAESRTETTGKTSVEKIFASVGITPETIATKFRELQEAKDVRLASFEGKFTDRVDVPDGNVQFRATEATAKILGLFPKEDTAAVAQLFVRLPDAVLTKGHPQTCTCAECCSAWESITVSPTESTTK